MKCELCKSESADRRLCSVCAEAIERVLQITIEAKHMEISADPEKGEGAAAYAGN